MDVTLVQLILMAGRIILPLLILVGIMGLGEFFRRRAEKKDKKEKLY
jgi:hypothetical protein